MNEIDLSILILTVPRRLDTSFCKLMNFLNKQCINKPNVEILGLYDNKRRTIGEKRQNLIDMAKGRYISFIDDDDMVSGNYVHEILNCINTNPNVDCIVFDSIWSNNGVVTSQFKFSINYYTLRDGTIYRKLCHVHVFKSSIVKKHKFRDTSYREDIDWLDRSICDVKKEICLTNVYYYYNFNSYTSESGGPLSHDTKKGTGTIVEHVENNIIKDDCKYSIIIAVRDEEMAKPIIESLSPLNCEVLIGKNYPSFSKLVNDVILKAKEEIVIFCSHKVRPTINDVEKLVSLLNEGYGLVGLYRLAFFGMRKELIRRIGFFDERFIGGEYEDNDFVIRLNEANVAYYEDESVVYHSNKSTWDNSRTKKIFESKWYFTGNTINRLLPELKFDYNLGTNDNLKDVETKNLFLPFSKSVTTSIVKYSIVQQYINHHVTCVNLSQQENVSVRTIQDELKKLCCYSNNVYYFNNMNLGTSYDTLFYYNANNYAFLKNNIIKFVSLLNKNGLVIINNTDPIHRSYLENAYCGDAYKIINYVNNDNSLNHVTLPISVCGVTIISKKEYFTNNLNNDYDNNYLKLIIYIMKLCSYNSLLKFENNDNESVFDVNLVNQIKSFEKAKITDIDTLVKENRIFDSIFIEFNENLSDDAMKNILNLLNKYGTIFMSVDYFNEKIDEFMNKHKLNKILLPIKGKNILIVRKADDLRHLSFTDSL